jgi:hypothetical protein
MKMKHDIKLLRAMFRISGITMRDFAFIMGIDQSLILDWLIGKRELNQFQADAMALMVGLDDGDVGHRPYYLSVGEDLRHLITVINRTSIHQQGFSFKSTRLGRYELRSAGTVFVIKRCAGARNKITIEDLVL